MSHNNGHNVLPTSPREVWPYMRDNAKPVTPLDAYYLAQCRTYCPPSKAHVKRLLKLRPQITKARPKIQIDQYPKLAHNDAARMGREARAVNQRAVLVERCLQGPLNIKPEATIDRLPRQLVHESRVKPEVDEWDMDRINRNLARLEAEHIQALATVNKG